jgi:hypothetical protein
MPHLVFTRGNGWKHHIYAEEVATAELQQKTLDHLRKKAWFSETLSALLETEIPWLRSQSE